MVMVYCHLNLSGDGKTRYRMPQLLAFSVITLPRHLIKVRSPLILRPVLIIPLLSQTHRKQINFRYYNLVIGRRVGRMVRIHQSVFTTQLSGKLL
jgi:hypothetical protein